MARQAWLQRRHTLLGRDETEAIITITKALHLSLLIKPLTTEQRICPPFLCATAISCLCSNVDLTSFHFFFSWCCPIRLFVLKNPLRASISQIHHADATWRHLARHEHETRLPNLTRHHNQVQQPSKLSTSLFFNTYSTPSRQNNSQLLHRQPSRRRGTTTTGREGEAQSPWLHQCPLTPVAGTTRLSPATLTTMACRPSL